MVFDHESALTTRSIEVNDWQGKQSPSGRRGGTSGPSTALIERDGFRPTARRLGYIRVSTSAQLTDRQVMQLEAECDELRIEHVSAVAAARPVFDALMTELERGDTLVVVDLDRAFRSSIDAIMTAEALRERGIHFQLLNFPLDTASEEGELFYTILAAFAQFERRIISRRTREGLDAARRRGVRLGRPPSLSPDLVREAHNWLTEAGLPCAYVAALLGVSRLTLQRRFRRLGLPYPITPPAVGLDENPGPTNPQE